MVLGKLEQVKKKSLNTTGFHHSEGAIIYICLFSWLRACMPGNCLSTET